MKNLGSIPILTTFEANPCTKKNCDITVIYSNTLFVCIICNYEEAHYHNLMKIGHTDLI